MQLRLGDDEINYNSRVLAVGSANHQFCTGSVEALLGRNADPYISPEAYAEMLNKAVIGCVDVIFYYVDANGREWVFLPRRTAEPQPNTWVVGGRRNAFMTLEQAAIYNLRREVGDTLDLEELRFEEIPGEFDLIWDTSRQGGPSHTRSKVLAYCLTDAERGFIKLNGEYTSGTANRWFPLASLLAYDGPNMHPALRAMLAAFRDRKSNYRHLHTTPVYTAYRAVHRVEGVAGVTTSTIYTVHGMGVVGNRYHLGRSVFDVQRGDGTLTRAMHGGKDSFDQNFQTGDVFTIGPVEKYAFSCAPGTRLAMTTDWLFGRDTTVQFPLITAV